MTVEARDFTGPRMLGAAAGFLADGNVRAGWDARCRYDFANPDHG